MHDTDNIVIQRAEERDQPYIDEKLKKYLLDAEGAEWHRFFVAKQEDKTVAFGRVIDHGDYLEVASLGVDYYHRGKGIGFKMLLFLVDVAKKMDPVKDIYGVTHRPGFLTKAGFKEVQGGPETLEYKRHHKCKLDASQIKIMKFVRVPD
jgi:N-acetylglutamate synthase-like GNAT family acetyltransferase